MALFLTQNLFVVSGIDLFDLSSECSESYNHATETVSSPWPASRLQDKPTRRYRTATSPRKMGGILTKPREAGRSTC